MECAVFHKIFGDINLGSILGTSEMRSALPLGLAGKFGVRLVFSYGRTVGSKILNYNNILKNTGDLSYTDILNMDCDCNDSPFKHEQLGHIITGNLEIIKDGSLRQICSYGTKFRENPLLNLQNIRNQIERIFLA